MTRSKYMREWRTKHPEHRDYMRQWRAEHADQVRAYQRQYYETNRARAIASSVQWQRDHVVEAAIHRKVAAANKRYEGRICAQDIRDLIDRDGWFCCWCKKAIGVLRDFTLEHLEPINDPAVLAIACASCNAAKLPRWGLTKRLARTEYLARRVAKKRAYDKQWKIEHRAQENAGQRARYHANLDARRAYFREWQRKKRERERGDE